MRELDNDGGTAQGLLAAAAGDRLPCRPDFSGKILLDQIFPGKSAHLGNPFYSLGQTCLLTPECTVQLTLQLAHSGRLLTPIRPGNGLGVSWRA